MLLVTSREKQPMGLNRLEAEEERIRVVYSRRDASGKPGLYAWHRQEVLLSQYRFRSVAAAILVANGLHDIGQLEVLDVGCGSGGWLLTLLTWGASSSRLHGIDLLQDRIENAKSLMPGVDCQIASGYSIPHPDASMDLISAHTVFSSIIAADSRKALAQEMQRVLKPQGKVLIYDFRVSDPRNPDTVSIRKAEINRLFPGLSVERRTLTLAPPLSRRLAKCSPVLTHLMESFLPFLRTHAFYLINRKF